MPRHFGRGTKFQKQVHWRLGRSRLGSGIGEFGKGIDGAEEVVKAGKVKWISTEDYTIFVFRLFRGGGACAKMNHNVEGEGAFLVCYIDETGTEEQGAYADDADVHAGLKFFGNFAADAELKGFRHGE